MTPLSPRPDLRNYFAFAPSDTRPTAVVAVANAKPPYMLRPTRGKLPAHALSQHDNWELTDHRLPVHFIEARRLKFIRDSSDCLLYTSDAADE